MSTTTCTNHNDAERTACPVCLVAALTAERDQLRTEVKRLKRAYEYDHKCLCEVRDRCELWKQRAQKAEADLAEMHKSFAGNVHTENRELRAEAAETVALANWNGALERAMKAEAELAIKKSTP
jgi:hypothetical protein